MENNHSLLNEERKRREQLEHLFGTFFVSFMREALICGCYNDKHRIDCDKVPFEVILNINHNSSIKDSLCDGESFFSEQDSEYYQMCELKNWLDKNHDFTLLDIPDDNMQFIFLINKSLLTSEREGCIYRISLYSCTPECLNLVREVNDLGKHHDGVDIFTLSEYKKYLIDRFPSCSVNKVIS